MDEHVGGRVVVRGEDQGGGHGLSFQVDGKIDGKVGMQSLTPL